MGLRIIERVREEYGGDADAHIAEEMNPFTNPSKAKKALQGDAGTHLTPKNGASSYANDRESIGGGFLVDDDTHDDDLGGGGFLPEGHDEVKVPRRAGELTIEDEGGPVNSDRLNGCLPTNSKVTSCGPSDTDHSEGTLTEADSDDKVKVPQQTSANGKKAAAKSSLKGNVSTHSPNKRAAPKRKAARKSEMALKSHFFENKSDEDDNSKRGNLKSKEVVVEKPAKRNNNKGGSGPSLRARKSTLS